MRVVVDASVLMAATLAGARGPLDGHELVTPPLGLSETTSALSEMAWRGEIPRERVTDLLGALEAIDLEIVRPDDLPRRAWSVAERLGWAKTYDAEYVAIAELLGLTLVTLDTRLRRGAGHLIDITTPTELQP